MELLQLPYAAMSANLFANNVITIQEKLEVEKVTGAKQMEKILDIIIQSLSCKVTAKYNGFLKAMVENDDIVLHNKVRELGKRIKLTATYIRWHTVTYHGLIALE